MSAKYAVGIDLGTTNSVLAYTPLESEIPQVQILPIPQVVAPGQIESLPGLPSFLYLPTDEEVASGVLALPGQDPKSSVVGQYARHISAEQPERTVAAAKSWLCYGRVDRHSPILPWDAPPEVSKISPVAATVAYLKVMVQTWNNAFPDAALNDQQVVLTVPASFDMAARELTREAAATAGLPENFVLLEEPQAAVYHWLNSSGDHWRRQLKKDDILLVCDVGGGTTDLTLVCVDEEQGELTLRRLAVGNHLLVGGDNMDVALAHYSAKRFAEQGVKLNAWQSVSLWHSCRKAKESLLSKDGTSTQTISVLGRGSRLIGGTVSIQVNKDEVESLLVDGFMPLCDAIDRPQRHTSSGFQEIGLPFESDTAITKHVAAFLGDNQNSASPSDQIATPGQLLPTHLLFNGGVFKSTALRQRMVDVIGSWGVGQSSPTILGGPEDLDQAVACGAAYYGWTKAVGGIRIRGGTARSYYVGIETSGLAIPGMPRPLQAICVVPFGMEEGTELDVPSREVGLIVGQPARFRFFASASKKDDRVGTVVKMWDEEELVETAPMELTLPAGDDASEEGYVPVRFHSKITELGVFELWCLSTLDDQRWKLEFNVRENIEAGSA